MLIIKACWENTSYYVLHYFFRLRKTLHTQSLSYIFFRGLTYSQIVLNPYKAHKTLLSGTTSYFTAWQTLKLPVFNIILYVIRKYANSKCITSERVDIFYLA